MEKIIHLSCISLACLLLCCGLKAQGFLTNGLVAYYPFNGNANDASGNGNNGNLGPGIGFGPDRFGNPNSALFFTNGIAGEMTTTVLQPASNVFTIAMWFNLPTSYNNNADLIALTDTQSGAYTEYDKSLEVGPVGGSATTNNLSFYLFPGYEVFATTPENVADGQWHHAVATLSSQGMMLYLDGNLVATNSDTASQGFAGYWRSSPGQGSIDDIRIYNRALSSNEVAQLYANEAAVKIVPLTVAINATMTIETTNSDNGTVTTVKPAMTLSITSKSLLPIIAQDEFNEGNYGSTDFPKDSVLVLMNDQDNFSDSYFVVEDSAGAVLVNVSDLMDYSYQNLVLTSGKEADATGLLTSLKESYIGTFSFNDTGAGGDLTFALQGLTEVTVNDTATPRLGTYTENVSANLSSGNGTASLNGATAVITGTASGNGKAVFLLP
jgi:hypothetical protein